MAKATSGSRAAAGARIGVTAAAILVKAVAAAFAISTPLLGVWLSSSLAAYKNGPIWTSILLGLGLFPLLPLGWEWLSTFLRNRKNPDRKRILKLWDRLLLRTLAINLAFLFAILAVAPQSSFRALQTRGDWMLDGRHGTTANRTRVVLFTLADWLEWLYEGGRDNPYDKYDDGAADKAKPTPNELPVPEPEELPVEDESEDPVSPVEQRRAWPLANSLHLLVTAIPTEVETDYQTVARYIGERETDPYLLVKALHDYVADRIAYDAPALAAGDYPPQDVETVFRTRTAVCAGYAKLLAAMARELDIEMVYVVGDARGDGDDVDGLGHAWNAVEIEDRWFLIDVTWDAGTVEGAVFTKGYKSDYLLAPPELFGLNHLPKDSRWQLRDQPLSRGDFMRQPMMAPAFFRQGFRLLEPTRSQISVDSRVRLRLANSRRLYVLASTVPKGGGVKTKCRVDRGEVTSIYCELPGAGRYQVKLYSSPVEYGDYPFIGQIEVNSR